MSAYLLIVSRDPVEESGDTRRFLDMATDLARSGSDIVLWLVHNGVFAARDGVAERILAPLAAAGVKIMADDFSIRERGIPADRVSNLTRPAPIGDVVTELVSGRKTLWH